MIKLIVDDKKKVHLLEDGLLEYTSPPVTDTLAACHIVEMMWQQGEYDGAMINVALGEAQICPTWDKDGKIFRHEFDDGGIVCHRNIHTGVSEVLKVWLNSGEYILRPFFGRKDMDDESFAEYAYSEYKKELESK